MKSRQGGAQLVEFALVGSVFFVLLFGLMAVAYWFHVYDTLTEAVRRGARVAAVCQNDATDIYRATVFAASAGDSNTTGSPSATSPILPGLSTDNVTVTYTAPASGNYAGYVTVTISNYSLTANLPMLPWTLTFPTISAALSTESLGRFDIDPTSVNFGSRKCLMP